MADSIDDSHWRLTDPDPVLGYRPEKNRLRYFVSAIIKSDDTKNATKTGALSSKSRKMITESLASVMSKQPLKTSDELKSGSWRRNARASLNQCLIDHLAKKTVEGRNKSGALTDKPITIVRTHPDQTLGEVSTQILGDVAGTGTSLIVTWRDCPAEESKWDCVIEPTVTACNKTLYLDLYGILVNDKQEAKSQLVLLPTYCITPHQTAGPVPA